MKEWMKVIGVFICIFASVALIIWLVLLIPEPSIPKYYLCDDSGFGGNRCLGVDSYTIQGNCAISGDERVCGNYQIEVNK